MEKSKIKILDSVLALLAMGDNHITGYKISKHSGLNVDTVYKYIRLYRADK